MDKGNPPSLFVNDGSFMERFKQLQQQEKEKKAGAKDAADVSASTRSAGVVLSNSRPVLGAARARVDAKGGGDQRNPPHTASGGKLAFSLKQKSKVLTPSRLAADDEEEKETSVRNGFGDSSLKRQKLSPAEASPRDLKHSYIAPPAPVDPTVKKVADSLANFVAKHGRQLEHVTRQKNPGDTPFKFLFDETCADYKYYEYRLAEEEIVLQQSREAQVSRTVGMGSSMSKPPSISAERSTRQNSNYFTPASALHEDNEPKGESSASHSADPIAMMEFYMKKAAREESRRKPKMSKDEMPPPPSLQGPMARGHHMGDYIPPEELEKFLASCNDAAAQRASKESAEKAKIQADNVGHKLLSKMGWKEGEGLGSSKSGIANPIAAGDVKINNLGVGAHQPGEVTAEDDIYEQYKKRMMLGYRHRPNPLNNPRKAYY
ncbi:hypothetical protein MLD38_024041 [Melastoma candidum]|uniref:Uncharacterized protein n=1 Tax=Melastoma candidum TaxID=119954 RepID=A0ACB9NR48_9MYRT|nr:hypothetical protein MLD38_024041 [Melastoma candidum]